MREEIDPAFVFTPYKFVFSSGLKLRKLKKKNWFGKTCPWLKTRKKCMLYEKATVTFMFSWRSAKIYDWLLLQNFLVEGKCNQMNSCAVVWNFITNSESLVNSSQPKQTPSSVFPHYLFLTVQTLHKHKKAVSVCKYNTYNRSTKICQWKKGVMNDWILLYKCNRNKSCVVRILVIGFIE